MAIKHEADRFEGETAQEKAALMEFLRQKDSQLEAVTRRLESVIELTRMIVHDLKGPLAIIMSNLDMLRSPERDCVEREILETAMQGGDDLLNIINTLLELGKMEQGNFELNLSVIDLAETLKATAGKLKTLLSQKNRTLEIDCCSKISSLAADAMLIERVIVNLVMNAIKYTHEGSTITLMTRDGATENTVLIAVSDTGIGIPPERHKIIFDLYAQFSLPGEGTADRRDCGAEAAVVADKSAANAGPAGRRMANVGIGLAFCKRAAEQHGGSVWVESEVGKGSTFYVSLPTNLIPSGSDLI